MSDRTISHSLREIKEHLVAMSLLVETGLEFSIDGLIKESLEILKNVYPLEDKVNQAHILIDDLCIKAIALHQPMANDLRFIVSSIKINSDLERMSDQCINCLLYTSPSPRDRQKSRMPSSA